MPCAIPARQASLTRSSRVRSSASHIWAASSAPTRSCVGEAVYAGPPGRQDTAIAELAVTMVTAADAEDFGGRCAAFARRSLVASAPLLLGMVLAVLFCYPFVVGRLLLLDYVSGPHQPLLPAQAFGLNGALTGGVPLTFACNVLDRVLGQAGSVVPAVIFFPLAT